MINKFILTTAKYVAPIFVVIVPVVILYGHFYPWLESKDALSKYSNDYALLVGQVGMSSLSYEKLQKTYIVLQPDKLASITVTVTVDSNGKREVNTQEGGFLYVLFTYILLLLITWWFWFRPKTHNTRLQADASRR